MLDELQRYSRGDTTGGFDDVHAEPGGVHCPPIWLLGSSGASARMAGAAGMGYSFAAHFSPAPPAPAMRTYRDSFQPRSEEHTSELQSLMRLSYAVFCLKQKITIK